MHPAATLLLFAAALPGASLRPARAAAQHVSLRAGAQAVGAWTLADPAVAGDAESEAYLTHPYLLAHASLPAASIDAQVSINLEGLTLRRGELAAGNTGEGYIDRRHPHTYLHEAVLVLRPPRFAGVHASIAAGRGFVPFGTDDPMVRPFVKYPANHHLAQLLERIVVSAAVRRGALIVEAGWFNGDEPTGPSSLGEWDRFGDSWSARATALLPLGFEAQVSRAFVTSPEHVFGGGVDHRKWSASLRYADAEGSRAGRYALLEWARTQTVNRGRPTFAFATVLAEAALPIGDWRGAARFERSTRPEEERLRDPFRSARPHAEENLWGITRWTTVTGRVERPLHAGALRLAPFVEVAYSAVRETEGAIFDPVEFYGADRLWNVSIGLRLDAGLRHSRMGRYGVAVPDHAHPAAAPAAGHHVQRKQ